ncbi:MAG: hypothetical protein EWV53_13935 [Microcystis panniformis Mp_MB_F_20051200_S9]|uniref:Uncharacterized protein n=1 Tax=Microcystis panniformis Mp_MB_F_20051200_S9 TaxID=2486223 RepID=A0A552PV51_9CHRO|nr:MAG: hypothetical protein EWV43_18205 [Microcystis panniformis Mp_MB_F_20080800_S26D]TRV45883.1 MAG: hypothetical protein EWV87_16660 [Microcystis panniformis Mp_GB_SS_20050300_S99]TRV47727.1 MAG: hypothetical protein EWV42_15950 [Microcystis panniformis Mp_GB_SS_20050300_S99D]TRV54403.1 MAG: hypothetical protein EWV69_22325 [Microcystis panniformis Mp_MB_F_20080800_S26]TRV56456.1 MAG: hypothetical protein EWV86_22565 [Microcystis panniformis Mp_MB_F_20051200_S9D]TRV60796.1 MAG: hypothetica
MTKLRHLTYTYLYNGNPCLPTNPSFLGGIDRKKSTDLNQLSDLSFKCAVCIKWEVLNTADSGLVWYIFQFPTVFLLITDYCLLITDDCTRSSLH